MQPRFAPLVLVLSLLALAACAKAPRAASPEIAQRAARIAAKMTLEEQVGQVFMVSFPGDRYAGGVLELVGKRRAGGVILYSVTRNTGSAADTAGLVRELQIGARGAGHLVPLFVAVDQEGGPVNRLTRGVTLMPSQMAQAATKRPGAAYDAAEATAAQLAAVGVNVNFAPVADVNYNPDNPIIGIRSFGQDPAAVSRFTARAVRGYEARRVLCAAKHFPGHGNTAVDSHHALPRVKATRDKLSRVELAPFRAAIEAGAPMIMTAHIDVPNLTGEPGLPATMSRAVLTDLLRDEMGFAGIVVTDSLFMGAVMERFAPGEAAVAAFKAGADLLLFGADPVVRGEPERLVPMQAAAMDRVLAAVRSGEIDRERLQASVARIVAAKLAAGPGWSRTGPDGEVEARAHFATALAVARDSVALVRGRPDALPLAGRVLAVAPEKNADAARALALIMPGLKWLEVADDPSSGEIATVLEVARAAQRVVVFTNDTARRPGQAGLANALGETFGHRVVAVALTSPYDAASYPEVPTVLASFSRVPASLAAVAEVLAGRIPPRGTSPVDLGD